ncbi:hypothetical protein QBC35DRAFT_469728, partial [Podospora australis]
RDSPLVTLAILGEDTTKTAERLLGLPRAVKNAQDWCAQSVDTSGTWVETPDYWYFGTQAHAQLSSALLTATGSAGRMLDSHPAFRETGFFHIYNQGITDKFNYGDCGPSKITATANSLFFYSTVYNIPEYALYQRDRPDAADPLTMLWYEPGTSGEWYKNLPLDRSFSDIKNAWVSMRSSWTDPNGVFVAMKAGRLSGHATHGNLDAGDFVLDALGERWATELCQDSYDAPGYFSSEAQDSVRWQYYRCGTSGQNTIVYNNTNQIADAVPFVEDFQSSPAEGAFWVTDLSNVYHRTISIKRGVRLLEGRDRVLIQDEIRGASEGSQWRMHTRAEITYSDSGRVAHLRLNGKALDATILSPTTASFYTADAKTDMHSWKAQVPVTDLPNSGVNVLAVDIPAGNTTLAVLFCPIMRGKCSTAHLSLDDLEGWNLE